MTFDVATFGLVFNVANGLLTGLVSVYVYLLKRNQISSDRLMSVERVIGSRFDEHDHRLSKVEAACSYAPTHQDLGKIYERMGDVHGQVKELTGAIVSLQNTVNIVHEHLWKTSGGK